MHAAAPETVAAAAAEPEQAALEQQPQQQPPETKPVRLLRCGHPFCEPCIVAWLDHQPAGVPRSCPVCREPLLDRSPENEENEEAKHDPHSPGSSSSDNCGLRARHRGVQAAARPVFDLDSALFVFQLMRLRSQYPRFVSPELVSEWSVAPRGSSLLDFPAFVQMNPSYSTTSVRYSSSSSSADSCSDNAAVAIAAASSFGGGSSIGGGGGGGGW